MIGCPCYYILETRRNWLQLPVHFWLRERSEKCLQEHWVVLHKCLLHLLTLPGELGAYLVQEGREVLCQLLVELARVDALQRGRECLHTLTKVRRGQDVRKVHLGALQHEEGEILDQVDVYALPRYFILA